jgi:hypothetical protein
VTVVVTIPWRETPERKVAYDFVVAWYRQQLPDAPLVAADSGHDPFSRAASRNLCVRLAEDNGADVVVVNDADTVPDPAALRAAIDAAPDGRLHFGLDRMKYLTVDETAEVYAGRPIWLDGNAHDSSVLVLTPAAWWAAGGQDERFCGWGGEDGAFCSAATALIGVAWHTGCAMSLHHADAWRDVGSARWQPNSHLSMRYLLAIDNPDAVRQIIAERS